MGQDADDATGERILDAALATMVRSGVRKTSIESIARQAGISHMTIYRRWSRKQDLILAVLMREAQRLFARVDQEVAGIDTLEGRLVAGFTSIVWFFHTHPLMLRELDGEPESVLAALTLGADPMITTCTEYLAGHIRSVTDPATTEHADALAEILVRVSHSLVLSPPTTRPLETPDDVSDYARRHVLPLIRTNYVLPDRLPSNDQPPTRPSTRPETTSRG